MPFVLSTTWVKEGQTDALKAWYGELRTRSDEAFQALDREGVRQEVAFILNTEHGDLLAVFLEIDKDMDEANAAFFDSPLELDHQHRAVMDETTVGGAAGRIYAELQYALKNPVDGEREVHLG